MELLPIGDDKLKVTLTEADMEIYRLRADELDWDDTGTRKALWSILDEAKKRCGFDAARERVLVQIFPSLSGGCEMFVTRVGSQQEDTVNELSLTRTQIKKEFHACFFGEMSDLISFCSILDESGYDGVSDAYLCDDGRTLLLYCTDDMRAAEFGEVTKADELEYYIGEHTSTICRENAVSQLAKLR